jgi:predicted dehydrogenase
MSGKMKVGVVGVGHLGQHHARLYKELDSVKYVGAFDADPAKSNFPKLEALADAVDAVSVATPTESHAAVARVFLERGKHVLVEKPITKTVAEAGEMVALARKHNCVLQVGHVERFNPVLRYLNETLTEAAFMEVHRLSPYPKRSLDIGVVLDLMIHDLDIVLAIAKSPLTSVDAVGIPVLSASEDIANARLKFANGCVVNLTASRVSPEKMRKIRVFGRTQNGAAYISLDYMRQEGQIYRLADENARESSLFKKLMAGKDATLVSEFAGRKIMREPVPIAPGEPLKLELQSFIESIRHRRDPLVTGEAAQQALEVAMEITALCRKDSSTVNAASINKI